MHQLNAGQKVTEKKKALKKKNPYARSAFPPKFFKKQREIRERTLLTRITIKKNPYVHAYSQWGLKKKKKTVGKKGRNIPEYLALFRDKGEKIYQFHQYLMEA